MFLIYVGFQAINSIVVPPPPPPPLHFYCFLSTSSKRIEALGIRMGCRASSNVTFDIGLHVGGTYGRTVT